MYKKNKGVNYPFRLLSATNLIKPMPTRAKVVEFWDNGGMSTS